MAKCAAGYSRKHKRTPAKKIPKSFDGHSLSVSDVLVLNREGEITAYYVEKEGFTVIAGFIRIGSSGALLTFETTNFHIEGKAGSWLVLDTLIIDGREFFLWNIWNTAGMRLCDTGCRRENCGGG
ncbi:MAG: YodL domain-containing protein [Streptococcus sp.]